MWDLHPSAAQSKDPATFRDIGNFAKSNQVFFDGRRRIALTVRDDMAVVRPRGDAKSLRLPDRQTLENGPAPLVGAYNYGWCRSANAYFVGDLTNMKALTSETNDFEVFPVFQAGATVWGLSDRICVRFLPGTPSERIDRLFEEYGVEVIRGPEDIGSEGAYDLRVPGAYGDSALVISNALAREEGVDYSSPDWICLTRTHLVPSDSLYPNQWHLESLSTSEAVPDSDINVEQAWERTLGTGIRVCVIDDGMDYDHEDLRILTDRTGRKIGFDPIDGDNDPSQSGDDSHGTSVGGVIAAQLNNLGVVGVAPDAGLMAVRIVGYPASSSDFRDSFLFALENDADVCNNSWGIISFTDPCTEDDDNVPIPIDPIERDGLERLINNGRNGLGCVVLFAAGNDRVNIAGNELNGHPDVVSVAASNNLAKRSWYSSYGPPIDVCAPSNDFDPTRSGYPCPDIWTGGKLGITTTDPSGRAGSSETSYRSDFGGTSSACPTTCGVAALILSATPSLTRLEVINLMKSTATKIDQEGGEYDDSGFSIYYGFGRVDAAAAVGGGSAIPTFTPTSPPTPTLTPTPTNTPTETFTPTETNTPTNTFTPTNTPTPTPTFTPRVTHMQETVSVGENPVSIAAADLDGINFDDILTANRSGDGLSISLNDGSGRFPSGNISIEVGEGSQPSFVTTGDLDNDGDEDILTIAAGTDQVVAFLQSDSKGNPDEEVAVGDRAYVRRDFGNLDVDQPISAFIGDIDGDNRADLAIANSEGDDLTIVFGTENPDELFDSAGERVDSRGRLPVFVTGGVLINSSPTLQLLVTNWEDATLSVLALDRNADGTVSAEVDVYPVGVNPRHLVVADFDNDGDNDVAVVNQGAPQMSLPIDGSISLFFNVEGTGTFRNPDADSTLVPGGNLLNAAAFDFDKNGYLDLAISQRDLGDSLGHLFVYYNDSASFTSFDPFDGPGTAPLAVVSAALNGGLPPDENVAAEDDLLITDQTSNSVGVVTITGDLVKRGTFADLNFDRSYDSLDLFLFALFGSQRDPLIRRTVDLSGEGILTAEDLLLFLRFSSGAIDETGTAKRESDPPVSHSTQKIPGSDDVNGDGRVTVDDFLAVFD